MAASSSSTMMGALSVDRRLSYRSCSSRSVRCSAADSSNVKFQTLLDSGPKLTLECVKREHELRCECHDLFKELVPYVRAWEWQKEIVDRMREELAEGKEPANSVIVLQHPPVYTMGTRSSEKFLRFDKDNPPYELHRTERGGEITYHGPGQLVMYPILNLRDHKMDLHWYMRMLEEVVIRTLWSACGLVASRVDGLTGVWVGKVKVAAIGVRVSRWITYHGLALNVNTDLSPFQKIVPCGIADRPVGSISQLLKDQELPQEVFTGPVQLDSSLLPEMQRQTQWIGTPSKALENSLKKSSNWTEKMLLHRVHDSLLVEFANLFQVQLVPPTREGPRTSSEVCVS